MGHPGLPMRPTALESLYRDLEVKFGYQERILPANHVIRPLNMDDVKAAAELEKACFPPAEQASEEKIAYRIREAPELTSGVFAREYDWKRDEEDVDGVAATRSSLVKETLVAHIHATKMVEKTDIDAAMEIGSHKETGRYIAVHSVAVTPEYRGKGLAHTLLKDYVQRLFSLHTADAIVIIAHKELIHMYEKVGFQSTGESKSSFGDGGWYDMVLPFDAYDDEDEE